MRETPAPPPIGSGEGPDLPTWPEIDADPTSARMRAAAFERCAIEEVERRCVDLLARRLPADID
mgnify:CR=1 FL=1